MNGTDETVAAAAKAADTWDTDIYQMTINFPVDLTSTVETRLARLGVPRGIETQFDIQVREVPVRFLGPLEDLMEIALKMGLELEEFEEMTSLLVARDKHENRDEI